MGEFEQRTTAHQEEIHSLTYTSAHHRPVPRQMRNYDRGYHNIATNVNMKP
jgi:hypothetical protein